MYPMIRNTRKSDFGYYLTLSIIAASLSLIYSSIIQTMLLLVASFERTRFDPKYNVDQFMVGQHVRHRVVALLIPARRPPPPPTTE